MDWGREVSNSRRRKKRRDVLTGQTDGGCDRDGWTFHREERSSEQRTRTVRLPPSVDKARLSAKVEDGVLRVTLPKLPAAPAGSSGRTSIPVE